MHRVFQRDLCRLRLTAARTYVKVRRRVKACIANKSCMVQTITDGGSSLATVSGANLRLNASVTGLGPRFKVNYLDSL